MVEPGPLLAAGRDSEIFELGPDRVLRRARSGRSLEGEGRTIEHVRAHGYPAPRVDEVRAGGAELVMERVIGPTMGDDLARRPWRLRAHAALLADLHRRLHRIDAPDWFADAPGGGRHVVHLDLHPMNVLLSPTGPVVIDWPNAARGEEPVDVATTWALMAVATVPGGAAMRALAAVFRRRLVAAFLAHFDRAAVAAALGLVVGAREHDPNLPAEELDAMRRLMAHEVARQPPDPGPSGAT